MPDDRRPYPSWGFARSRDTNPARPTVGAARRPYQAPALRSTAVIGTAHVLGAGARRPARRPG